MASLSNEDIRIVPFLTCPVETVDTGIVLEVGKTYLNTLGQERTIVGTYDDDPYVFIDDQEFTYTRDGVYDLPDYWANADLFALVEEVK